MILRFIINFVRWSWGYPSLPMPETIDKQTKFLMFFGVCLDTILLILVILALIQLWDSMKK